MTGWSRLSFSLISSSGAYASDAEDSGRASRAPSPAFSFADVPRPSEENGSPEGTDAEKEGTASGGEDMDMSASPSGEGVDDRLWGLGATSGLAGRSRLDAFPTYAQLQALVTVQQQQLAEQGKTIEELRRAVRSLQEALGQQGSATSEDGEEASGGYLSVSESSHRLGVSLPLSEAEIQGPSAGGSLWRGLYTSVPPFFRNPGEHKARNGLVFLLDVLQKG